MNRNTVPQPPDDLLARCLATIPQTATRKPTPVRLFPDAGSRKRLAWLTVAAAIPVVTVLAVLPVKHWYDNKKSGTIEALAEAKTGMVSFCSSITTYREKNPYSRDASEWYTNRAIVVQRVWQSDKGYYAIGGTVENVELLSGNYKWNNASKLESPDGTIYQRLGEKVEITKRTPEHFRHTIASTTRSLFEPEWVTDSIGYGRSTPVVEKRVRGQFLGNKEQPRSVEVVVCLQRPSADLAKRGAPTIRVRFYRDLKSGLCYAHEAYAFWEKGERTEQNPLLVERVQYRYEKKYASLELLDPVKFKKGM